MRTVRSGVAALAAACCLGAAGAGPAAAAADAPTLTTDATGPLFTVTRLNGGVVQEGCLRLTWSDVGDQVLGLSVRARGDLLEHLDVQVATGSGGAYQDCAGFRTDRVAFTGTLAALATQHPAPADQLPLRAGTAGTASTSVRIRVTPRSDRSAQGRSAVADLVFAAVPVPPEADRDPGPDPTAAPDPSPEPTPAPDPTSAPEPATGTGAADQADGGGGGDAGPADGGPVTPEPTAAPGSPAEPGHAEPTEPAPAPQEADVSVEVPISPRTPSASAPGGALGPVAVLTQARDAVVRALGEARERVVEASGPVASGVRWTFWSLPPVLLFLLVQDRIDRRDPKLAHAPAAAAPTLPFDDGYDHESQERT